MKDVPQTTGGWKEDKKLDSFSKHLVVISFVFGFGALFIEYIKLFIDKII